jgi:outer membrane protein assembly factor BamB
VYFVYHNIPLTAFNPDDGSIRWSTPLGVNDHCFASPAIGSDGTIVVATNPGILYAVSPAGQIRWTFDTRTVGYTGTMRSSPAVDADGTIYFGTNEGSPAPAFFALRPDGTLAWRFDPSDLPPDTPSDHFDIYSSPAIGSDGTIYFGQEFGRVYALDPSDGSVRWMQPTHQGITWCSPTITRNGVLLIADLEGTVYAIQTDSRGLKESAPWPKFRHDAQNSACRVSGG